MHCLNVQTTRPKPYPWDYEGTPFRRLSKEELELSFASALDFISGGGSQDTPE